MVGSFLGVTIVTASVEQSDGMWHSRALLYADDGATEVEMWGWPLKHDSEQAANVTAIATAKRRIHRGQWRDNEPSDFASL
jgi:hypothetical protein